MITTPENDRSVIAILPVFVIGMFFMHMPYGNWIMLGFTFFSASMWVGQQLAEGLDFWGFVKSLILGGVILGAYTGLLGYVGAKTGLSL